MPEARDLIVEAKKRSLGFGSSLGGKNRALARGAIVAMCYGEVKGSEEDPETRYFVPREGTETFVDLPSVPAKAPHRDLAKKIIHYMLEARVAAQNANFIRNATANQTALEFINPIGRNNPAMYPPAEIRGILEYNRDLGEASKLYDELWRQVKAK